MSTTPSPTGSVPVSRTTWVLGGVAVLLSLAVALVLFNRFGDVGARATVRSYEVLSDTAVRVDFQVVKAPGETVVCTVRARDASGAEAGIALVRVGPSSGGSVLVSHELVTTSRANTGEVTGCSQAPAAPMPAPPTP